MYTEEQTLVGHDTQHDETPIYGMPQSDLPLEKIEQGTGNYAGAFFNVLNTTIGAGLLALPFAFRSGIILGTLLLIFVMLLASFTFTSMIYLSDLTGKFSFKEIAVVGFNKYAGVIFEATNLLFNIGGIVGYVVVIGQLGPPVINTLLKRRSMWSDPKVFEAAVMILIMFPLCCARKISFLSYASGLSITSALYAIFAVCYRSIEQISRGQINWSKVEWFSGDVTKIFFSLPILFFAYGSIVTLLPSYRDVKNRTFGPMTIVTLVQMVFAGVLYWIMGFFGYIMFTDSTRDNILKNFTDPNDIMMTVARVAITIVIILSFPLIHWICRESIEQIFFSGWEFTWFRWIGEALLLCSIAYLLGAFIPSITVVFGFTGATGGSLVVFVYPSMLMAKMAKNRFLRIFGVISAIVSAILGTLCTIIVILDTFGVLK